MAGKTRYSQRMTLNVSLTPHLEQFIQQTVTSGRFQSVSELVRTALRLLEEREHEHQAKLQWLRQEIQKGLDSGPASPLDMEALLRECDEQWPQQRE
jgi:antitoxin ParD1/3/4